MNPVNTDIQGKNQVPGYKGSARRIKMSSTFDDTHMRSLRSVLNKLCL